MGRMFRLALQQAGVPDTSIVGELSDGDWLTLDAYWQQSEELRGSKPVRDGIPCSFELSYSEQDGLKTTAQIPAHDDLGILLHRLRPFILQKEPASFARACAILGRYITDPRFQQLLKRQHERYDGRRMQAAFTIVSDNVLVNSERTLNDWLNSYEYHRDASKRQAVSALFDRMPGDVLKAVLVSMLVDKAYAILNVAKMVAVVLGKTQTLNFTAFL